MKRNILKGLTALAGLSLLSACSSDYLDLKPITDISAEQAVETVEAAQLALNGICTAMQCQYQATNLNQFNGEGYVNTLYNDAFGQDVISGLGCAQWGTAFMNFEWSDYRNGIGDLIWMYYYNLVNRANVILDGIDNASGDEALRDMIKAQALTFRAHAYQKLLAYFGPRWEDSNNGETYCIVLRTKAGTDPCPLATMNEVVAQIKSDLDTAIGLYQSCGQERTYKWQPDIAVAYGVYSRLAMLVHDWGTAQSMAHDARQGYTIMDNNTYMAGFYMDNDDFMWESGTEESDIYYWSWGSHFAANGQYVNTWKLGGNAIDMTLYRQLDEKDIRRQLYFTPDKVVGTSTQVNPAKVKEDAFWNPALVNSSTYNDVAGGPTSNKEAVNGAWGLANFAVRYAYNYVNETFKGNIADINNVNFYAYYSVASSGKITVARGVYGVPTVMPFGAQFKFFSYGPYGAGVYNYMRSTEMCLNEAEAAYHNNDKPTALKCLKEVNDKRIPGYAFNSTGEDLLEEIRLCRRIELWGEGHSFTDFKRWKLPLNRVKWVAGDVTSGNWVTDVAEEVPVTANFGWRMVVPSSESDYNSAIDRNQLGYYTTE